MAITREFFLEMSQREFKSKIDALSLESGFKSFTRGAMSKNGNPKPLVLASKHLK
jgi:hypothetical protein